MSLIEEYVKKLAQPASSNKRKKKKAIRTTTRVDMNAVNRSLTPKIKQNAMVREASKKEAYNDDKSWI